tara:strand:+ start:2095 stop:7482 length:5388 start_codon:yes stop_codon:yes gene_type:complete
MLWDWSIAVSITLSLILGSVVASFFLKSVFSFRSEQKVTDLEKDVSGLRRSVFFNLGLSYLILVINSLIEIGSKIFELPAIFIYLLSIVWSNRQLIFFLSVAASVSFAIFNNGHTFLSSLDNSYRCNVLPIVNNIVFSVLHVVNYLYATYAPLWNTYFFLNRQLFIGTRLILTNCATSTLSLVSFFKDSANFFKTIFVVTLEYLGFPLTSANNNLVVNEYNMQLIARSLRLLWNWIPSALICSCQGVAPWILATLYGLFELDHLDYMVHHFFNAGITFMQVFLQALPPFLTYPDFSKVVYHIVSFIFENGVLFDAWLAKFAETFIQQLGANLIIDFPANFVGKALAHSFIAGMHAAETFGNSTMHTLIPFDRPTDVVYMQEVYSLDKTFSHLGMFTNNANEIISWSLQTLIYVLMLKTWENKCLNFEGCVQYASVGQCAVACEGKTIHIFATKPVCPVIIDMEEKYVARKNDFDNLVNELSGSYVNGFKSASSAPLLGNAVLRVDVTQVSNNVLVETSLGDEVIDKQLLAAEPDWTSYLRNAYLRRFHSIFDTLGCGFESLINSFVNIVHVFYDLSNTVLWEYFFGNAFDNSKLTLTELQQILQKHVGPAFGRDYDPPSYNPINITWSTQLRTYNGYQSYVANNSVTRFSVINFHEHVLYELDKASSFLIAHTLEENTFGKIAYNGFRLFVETIRSVVEFSINNKLDEKVGCNRNYNGTIGSCTSNFDANNKETLCAASNTEGCVCNPRLPLAVDSACQCIWKVEAGREYYTTEAVANYCRLNLFEFMFVFPKRVMEGARNLVQTLQIGNSDFPASPNKCLMEYPAGYKRLLYAQTQVFSKKYVTMYPSKQCSTYFSQDFACNLGDVLTKLTDLILDYAKDLIRNSFIIVGNIGSENSYGNIEIDFADEVCNIQRTISSVSPLLVAISNGISTGLQAPSKHKTKMIFSVLDITSVALQSIDILTISFRNEILDSENSGEFNFLDLFEDITINVMDVAFTWILQLIKAIADYEEPPTSDQRDIVSSFDDIYAIVTSLVRMVYWILDFIMSNLVKLFNTPGSAGYIRAEARLQRRLIELQNFIEQVSTLLLETFLPFVQDALVALKETLCGGLCIVERSIPGMEAGGLGSNKGFCEDYDSSSCKGLLDVGDAVGSSVSDVGSSIESFGADVISGIGSLFGRRRRLLNDEKPNIVSSIANKPFWNGTTTCDLMMRSLRQESLETLTRMEKVFFQDCVSRRVEGEAIGSLLHLPYAKDMFYNWKKPLQMIYHGGRIALIYVPWSFGNTSKKDLRYHLGLAGYDAHEVLHFMHQWQKQFKTIPKSQTFRRYRKEKDTTKRFVGNLHHLLFQTDWKKHQEILQSGIRALTQNGTSVGIEFPKDFRFMSKRMTSLLDSQTLLQDATFGLYTNVDCPEDSLLCLDCAIVDNFVYASLKQVEHSVDFYDGPYDNIIRRNFVQFWENTTDINRKYDKAYQESVNNRFGTTASMSSKATFNFNEWITGVFNMQRSVFEPVEGLVNFVNGNYTGDLSSDAVQIFPNDLYYYTVSIFENDCDNPDVIYTSHDDRVGTGLLNVLFVFVAWEVFQIMVIRFNTFVSLLVYASISTLSMFVYYYSVYGFNPFCLGMLPSFLVNDFLVWLDREVFLDCFCAYLPSLSKEPCAQQHCDTCDVSTEYYSCKDVAIGFDDLGPIWHFVFLFRWLIPNWFAEIGNSNAWPLPYLFKMDGMKELLQDVNRGRDPTSKEITCFYFNIMTPISVVIGSYLALLMCLPIVRIAVKIAKETLMIIIYMFVSLIYFARTLEE